MTLGILSLRPACHPSIPSVPSISCCSEVNWLMLLVHPSHHARLDLAPMSEGIGLPPNGWWSRWRLHRGVLVPTCANTIFVERRLREHVLMRRSAHYGSAGTVLQGIQSASVELITPVSRGARAGPSAEIRTGRAVQITLNQRHLRTASASSRIPILQKKNLLPSRRCILSWCCNYCNCFTWHSLLSMELHSLPPNEKKKKKKETQLRSGGVVSLFNYLFNTSCIMSII